MKYIFDKCGSIDFYDTYNNFEELKKGIVETMKYDLVDDFYDLVDDFGVRFHSGCIETYYDLLDLVKWLSADIETINKVSDIKTLDELNNVVSRFYSDSEIREEL